MLLKFKLFDFAEKFLYNLKISDTFALYANLLINLIVLIIVAFLLDWIIKRILISILAIIAVRTKSKFDDFLVANKTAKFIAHLAPLYFLYKKIPVVLDKFISWEILFIKSIRIAIIILSLLILQSILKALRDYLKQKPKYSDKPIDSYIQVTMIMLWIYAFVSIILILFNTNKTTLLTTVGSISALLILVFRDTILGLVASIQVTVNDMVRIGDWITVDKFGADGDVIEINLSTVKVRNFDNTTSTIPTYSLISDSFRNWRGMLVSDGRRIKRHVLIKGASIRFLNNRDIENLKKIQLIKAYLEKKQPEIQKYNEINEIDKSLDINGRNLTNFGVFRKYIQQYIIKHNGVNKDMPLVVRHLQPTEKGIPLEIYCFSKDKTWENYEYVIADIFDHIIACIKYFDLELFEVQPLHYHEAP